MNWLDWVAKGYLSITSICFTGDRQHPFIKMNTQEICFKCKSGWGLDDVLIPSQGININIMSSQPVSLPNTPESRGGGGVGPLGRLSARLPELINAARLAADPALGTTAHDDVDPRGREGGVSLLPSHHHPGEDVGAFLLHLCDAAVMPCEWSPSTGAMDGMDQCLLNDSGSPKRTMPAVVLHIRATGTQGPPCVWRGAGVKGMVTMSLLLLSCSRVRGVPHSGTQVCAFNGNYKKMLWLF